MRTLEVIFGGLVTLGIVNIVFFSRNTPAVTNSVFGGATNLFGTLTTNKGG